MLDFVKKSKSIALSLIAAVFLVTAFTQAYVQQPAQAATQTETELQNEIKSLKNKIDVAENQLVVLDAKAKTLESTLSGLRVEIGRIQAEIDLTKATLKQLAEDIITKQADIDHRKEILSSTFKALYQRSSASPLELLVASDSFSQYLDTQEYLERLKNGISDSVNEIIELKKQLQLEEEKQETLLSQQKSQETALETKKSEQQAVLNQTRGDEAIFQTLLKDLEAEEVAKQKELDDYIASLIANAVSLGPVAKGASIGKLGNTGWSSGPHLHIQVYKGAGNYREPISTIQNNGWAWPVGGNGGWVSQGYHSGHKAVDIAGTEGTPLLAIAAGDIIHRGCLYTGSNYATFGVIIDHGNGYYSSYIHMQAPNSSKFSACNTNRRAGGYYYGKTSIDYSVTN